MEFLDQYRGLHGPTVGEAWRAAREYEQLQLRIGNAAAARILELAQTTGWGFPLLTGMWDEAYGLTVYERGGSVEDVRELFEASVKMRARPRDMQVILDAYAPPPPMTMDDARRIVSGLANCKGGE